MILFAAYALIILYGAARYRRRPTGFAIALLGGLLPLALVPLMHMVKLGDGSFFLLVIAECAIVMGLGVVIASLPRRPAHIHCQYCHYDLRGLEHLSVRTSVCPECGMPLDGFASVRKRRATVFAQAHDDAARQAQPIAPLNGRPVAAEARSASAGSASA